MGKPKKYLVLFITGLLIALIVLKIEGFDNLRYYCDACFIAGFVIFSWLGFMIVSNGGGFDIYGYSGYYVGSHFRKVPEEDKYKNMKEYIDAKKKKREKNKQSLWPYVIMGGFFILSATIIYFIYTQSNFN